MILLLLCVSVLGYGAVERLSESGLYENIAEKTLSSSVEFYEPNFELWSDGATKKRWIQFPPGEKIRIGVDANHWIFPVGTRVWKEFSFSDQRVETRLMEKTAQGTWEFSSYQWTADESEAFKVPAEGVMGAHPITEGIQHDIPSNIQCKTCHRRPGDPVLGFDAVQLAGPSLAKLIEQNRFEDASLLQGIHPASNAAMGYFHANCGSCHNPAGSAKFTGALFHWDVALANQEEQTAYQTTVGVVSETFAIPGVENSYRIKPGSPEQSTVFYRMGIRNFSKMPTIGTQIVDTAGLETIKAWIDSL